MNYKMIILIYGIIVVLLLFIFIKRYKDIKKSASIFKDIKKYYSKIVLLLKRIKRLLNRMWKYFKEIVPTTIIVTIIIAFTVYIGILSERYKNIIDGLWDNKDLFLQSIIIVYFLNMLNGERQRNKNLKKQYNMYDTIQNNIFDLCNNIEEIFSVSYLTKNHNPLIGTNEEHEYINELRKYISKNLQNISEIKTKVIGKLNIFESVLQRNIDEIKDMGIEQILYNEYNLNNIIDRLKFIKYNIQEANNIEEIIQDYESLFDEGRKILTTISYTWWKDESNMYNL